jgi:hypothetical protein
MFALKEHVANICFKCFRCFRGTLEVFYIDVVKVDRDVSKVDPDVAYVAMVVYICCKRMFPMFHLFFRYMLQVCLSRYCICFTPML